MDNLISPAAGLIFLLAYGAGIIGLTAWIATQHRRDKVDFLLANRKLGTLLGAMSIASSWIWAPALFVSAQKAYEQGVAGVFWFTAPNFLALVVFAPLALRIRQRIPLGYTLPQYMRQRHGRGVHVLYLIQFFGLQICSYAVQILAGSTLIHIMTGLSFYVVAGILAAITLTYTVIGGLRSTIITDFLQMSLIVTVVVLTVPWVVARAGGLPAIAGGFGGLTGNFTNPFDPWVAYSFGIPATIGLLSGPIGDQMHWQRAFAMNSDRQVVKTFLLAALLFICVPLSLSLLGFVAANPGVSSEWNVSANQMIAPITVASLLPKFMALLYSLMVLAALCSTLDSVLCAASSLMSIDVVGADRAKATDEHDLRTVKIARLGMLITACLGIAIACIPGLQIVHLFLFYGTWRASTMIPTILTLYWERLNSRAVFGAISFSLMFGAPLFAIGTLLNSPHISVLGSLLVITIGLITCVTGTLWSSNGNGRQPASDRQIE